MFGGRGRESCKHRPSLASTGQASLAYQPEKEGIPFLLLLRGRVWVEIRQSGA